jgi:hypothetical protein
VGEVDGDAWAKGAMIAGMAYRWVPLKWVSYTYHGCKCFQAHSCLLSYSFSFKKLVRGHCTGLVTSGGNVSHKHFTEMRRLARDETPFPSTRSCFIIFYGSLCFLLRSFLLLSQGSLGEAS